MSMNLNEQLTPCLRYKALLKAKLWFWVTKIFKKSKIRKVFRLLLLMYSYRPFAFLTFLKFLPCIWRTPKFLGVYVEMYTPFISTAEPWQAMGMIRYCKNDWVQTIVSRKNGEPLCIYAPPKLHQDGHPLNTGS